MKKTKYEEGYQDGFDSGWDAGFNACLIYLRETLQDEIIKRKRQQQNRDKHMFKRR